MSLVRENVQVGWVDAGGRLWTMNYVKHQSVEGMTPCYARVGDEKDNGMDCLVCGRYIGYGSRFIVHEKSTCPSCHHDISEAGNCDCVYCTQET